MQPTLIPSKTDGAVAFLTERAQAARDEAADAEYERRERAEPVVTFADLLEELATTVSDADGIEFMECLAVADRHAVAQNHMTMDAAKKRIIARRLAQGN